MTDRKPNNIFIQGAISPSQIGEDIAALQRKTQIGGHSIFLGQVRADEMEGQTVRAIEYTAYEEMALEKMHQIREAIFSKYPLACLHVYHSLGIVAAGEICLFVFSSSVHRKDAMMATEEIVNQIKSSLPIWGKEIFTNDKYQWKK
ncbi:MAG: molybdenum cofactor biosynthesis protein MoaE [Bacteroidetes bacterium]|nr:molybdenum cofactor biosynthesis protein MoaE [Bacteroidota bacterium]